MVLVFAVFALVAVTMVAFQGGGGGDGVVAIGRLSFDVLVVVCTFLVSYLVV